MRITKVELFKAYLPLKRPFRIAIGETSVTDTLCVRIHTDASLYGMGEGNTFRPVVGETLETAFAAGKDLARLLIGADPLDIDSRVAQMRAFFPHNPTVRCVFDMALYDILGKAAGLPLYAVLAGQKRELVTDNTIGIDTPDTMAAHAVEFQERGFAAIKVKLGTTVTEDVARVAAIRKAVGANISLRLDANQGWDRVAAFHALDALAAFDIEYCEQPVPAWDMDALAAVTARSAIPIMADESLMDERDALKLIKLQACDYFNIKLAKSGGLHVAAKINAVAEAAGIKCMVGCMTETRLGLTASAHLASARSNIIFADLDGADMLKDDPVTGGMVYGAGGRISLPDTPGLGADIDPGFLGRLESVAIGEGV